MDSVLTFRIIIIKLWKIVSMKNHENSMNFLCFSQADSQMLIQPNSLVLMLDFEAVITVIIIAVMF